MELTQLGHTVAVPLSPLDAVIETIEAPRVAQASLLVDNTGTNYCVRFSCPEFSSLCPVTGQPDYAHLVLDIIPDRKLVESKSLKLYLASFRNWHEFHEGVITSIAGKLLLALAPKWLRIGGYFYPRGGIPIDVFWQSGWPPHGVWIPPQDIPPYRGR